jgi:hypothetical protein
VPSSLSTLMHPRRTPPPPVPVDLGRVMLIGTAVWLVAFVVLVVLAATGEASWLPAWVCVTGAVLGLLGTAWARRNARRTAAPAV